MDKQIWPCLQFPWVQNSKYQETNEKKAQDFHQTQARFRALPQAAGWDIVRSLHVTRTSRRPQVDRNEGLYTHWHREGDRSEGFELILIVFGQSSIDLIENYLTFEPWVDWEVHNNTNIGKQPISRTQDPGNIVFQQLLRTWYPGILVPQDAGAGQPHLCIVGFPQTDVCVGALVVLLSTSLEPNIDPVEKSAHTFWVQAQYLVHGTFATLRLASL